jgi:TRAP-type C4-dicarboxylate transport system substrate-binding protein
MYARQAIVTKYLSPTNFRPARIKATAQAGSMTFEWNHGNNPDENHYKAALAFAKAKGWDTDGHGFGALPSGGYVLTLKTDLG